MADPTMTAMPTQSAQASPDDGAPDTSQGYTICIYVDPNQAISVSVEPGPPPSDADQGGDQDAGASPDDDSGGGQGNSQSVPNINAAIRIVKDIFNNAGQVQDADQGQSDMSSGYGGQQ